MKMSKLEISGPSICNILGRKSFSKHVWLIFDDENELLKAILQFEMFSRTLNVEKAF